MLTVRNSVIFIFIILTITSIFMLQSNSSNVNRQSDDSTQSVVLEESRLKNEPSENLETLDSPLEELISETRIDALEEAQQEVVFGNEITVNYRGWRANDGFIFDESFLRGDAGFTFTVGFGVIEGWSEGVVGMKVGEVRRLKIPASLGYGEGGIGEDIPPNTDLIFDVELLEINN